MSLLTLAVPLLDEAPRFPGLLAAILAQDYPRHRLQIFLIDGGSTDGTSQMAAAAAATHPHLHLIANPRRIAAAGLNLALAQAQGEFLLRLDARTRPAPDYATQCIERLRVGTWAGVAGPQIADGDTPAARVHALALNHPFGVGAPRYRSATHPVASETLYLGAYRTAWLRQIDGWDETFGANEDFDLNLRLRQAGGQLLVDPAIHSTYLARETLGGLARQYYRYGAWRTITWRRHPRGLRLRHLLPALLLPALLGACFLLLWAPWPAILLLAAYLLLDLLTSLQLSLTHHFSALPRLLLTFPTLHLAWSLGFWSAWLRPPRLTKT